MHVLDNSKEMRVYLRVVVLEVNFQLDGFHKVAFLLDVGFKERLAPGA
jgi:hypothetical protein